MEENGDLASSGLSSKSPKLKILSDPDLVFETQKVFSFLKPPGNVKKFVVS